MPETKKKHSWVTPSSITFERMKIESSNSGTICTIPLYTKLHLGFLIGCFCSPQDPGNRNSLCNSAHFHAAPPPRRRPGLCRQNDHFCKRAPPVGVATFLLLLEQKSSSNVPRLFLTLNHPFTLMTATEGVFHTSSPLSHLSPYALHRLNLPALGNCDV